MTDEVDIDFAVLVEVESQARKVLQPKIAIAID